MMIPMSRKLMDFDEDGEARPLAAEFPYLAPAHR